MNLWPGGHDMTRSGPTWPKVAAAEAHVRDVVVGSGTSFYWGMRLLPAAKRKAMYAIYAFCREVDDVADGDAPVAAKLEELAGWRREVDAMFAGRPSRSTTLALVDPIARFDLPAGEFHAMIDGMEMDAAGIMRAPPIRELVRYCRCVAGAVGLLSIRVFGAPGEDVRRGALALGEALQLTNILRDLSEDAARGRLYLPRELLDGCGITDRAPMTVVAHPKLPEVCQALARRARQHFAGAHVAMAACAKGPMRPAAIMGGVYRAILDRLIQADWRDPFARISLPKWQKLWLAFRYGFL
jgi:presqualene diphosphate synthase